MALSKIVRRNFLRGDRFIVSIITVTLIFYLIEANQLERSSLGDTVGPGGFPTLLAVFGLILCAIFYLNVFRNLMPEFEEVRNFMDEFKGMTMLLMIIVYVVLIDFITYEAATFVFTAVATQYLGEKKWWISAVVAAVLTLACYLFFVWFLELNFQTGDFLLMLRGL